jgi:hypothetical protein
MQIEHAHLTSYYRGARITLHFVETRRPAGRRFGAEADARWKAFAGGLTATARLDLLIRDANAEWPGAFGARSVFKLDQVAEDDAFGAEWPGVEGVWAEQLWREAAPKVSSPAEAFEALAASWKLSLRPAKLPTKVDAAERLYVAGPSAIAQLAQHFAAHSDLDWASQVTCVATPPGHRQVAAFAAAVADASKPAALLSAAELGKLPKGVTAICSDDAAADDRAAVQAAG